MPAPSPFPQQGPPYPALYLYPLNDTFIPKHISLQQRVKIGRQTNAKTIPGERNGYFDSKVLSRQHAEVWEENGKIWIKDVKSSNGTFINQMRLSPEGVESEPYQLNTDDIVEFGIDIVGEDNKTIIHHKVAARVTCIITPEDAFAASRDHAHHASQHHQQHLQQQQQQQQQQLSFTQQARPAGPQQQPGRPSPTTTSGGPNTQNALANLSMGGLGGNARGPGMPGRSGLTFDHILSKLQTELQKSRDTGVELHGLNGAMADIQDSLGGAMPVVPSYPPPPAAPPPPPASAPSAAPQQPADGPTLQALQQQLNETHAWLASHVETFKALALDDVLSEHASLRRELDSLRTLVAAGSSGRAARPDGRESPVTRTLERGAEERDAEEDAEDEDDARSVATVTPGDNEQELGETDEEPHPPRPATPEPRLEGAADEAEPEREPEAEPEDEEPATGATLSRRTTARPGRGRLLPRARAPQWEEQPPSASPAEVAAVLALAKELEAQHAEARATIRALEERVVSLESELATRRTTEAEAAVPAPAAEPAGLAALIEWRAAVETSWAGEKEEWATERARLASVMTAWDTRARALETRVERLETAPLPAPPAPSSSTPPVPTSRSGMVTPPSPRRRRSRRRRSSGSASPARSAEEEEDADPRPENGVEEDEESRARAMLTPSSLGSLSHARHGHAYANGHRPEDAAAQLQPKQIVTILMPLLAICFLLPQPLPTFSATAALVLVVLAAGYAWRERAA